MPAAPCHGTGRDRNMSHAITFDLQQLQLLKVIKPRDNCKSWTKKLESLDLCVDPRPRRADRAWRTSRLLANAVHCHWPGRWPSQKVKVIVARMGKDPEATRPPSNLVALTLSLTSHNPFVSADANKLPSRCLLSSCGLLCAWWRCWLLSTAMPSWSCRTERAAVSRGSCTASNNSNGKSPDRGCRSDTSNCQWCGDCLLVANGMFAGLQHHARTQPALQLLLVVSLTSLPE